VIPFGAGTSLEGQVNAEISARDHHAVRLGRDLVEVIDAGTRLDLDHDPRAVRRQELAQGTDVVRGAHEGLRNEIRSKLERARHGRPISMEYETERQQRIVIVLDAGRMMASTLGELTKLDHAVNTALMLGYVATAKGDEVGVLGYSDQIRSFVPARRGRRQFLRITEALRRLEVTTTESDPRAAFEFLRARAARRALVVLFTDLIDTDASRGLVAAITRLAGNNLVLCCVLADPRLAELARDAPRTTAAAYERTIAQTVIEDRATALALLRRHGVHTIDVPSDRLTVAVIQRYLELKRRFL